MKDFLRATIGLELGSTRIKAVLIDSEHKVLASGEYGWQNKYKAGLWTYSLDDSLKGLGECYRALKADVMSKYGVTLTKVGAIGISGMMHGYLAFDKNNKLLVPFRTWRNNNAANAAKELTRIFRYKIPNRWSIAHLYQAIKDGEQHVSEITFVTTLAGYIHYKLTGQKVLGIGEASGMFPIDVGKKDYCSQAVAKFDNILSVKKLPYKTIGVLPKIFIAGDNAGVLTAEGAKLLDEGGDLEFGIPMSPPEGDAGTGMVATNSVKSGTGNISAGTSVFAMVVLERPLSKVYPEADIVTTPCGNMVAMVHCNNCTAEIDAWAGVFGEFLDEFGVKDKSTLYSRLFEKALDGDADCGGILAYNYLSGEHITNVETGRPMVFRKTESSFNLANFMRAQIYSAFATLKIGLDTIAKKEAVKIDFLNAHGGIFKTKGVAQRFLAAATGVPVTVRKEANEGGPYGSALLASYMLNGKDQSLSDYLSSVFAGGEVDIIKPLNEDRVGFEKFVKVYIKGLPIMRQKI